MAERQGKLRCRGYDEAGRRLRGRYSPKRLGLPVPKTEKAAKAQIRRILSQFDEGTFVEPSNLRVREYFEYWLTHVAALRLRPQSLLNYRRMLELYVNPYLGDLRLRNLTPMHVQSLYARLAEDGSLKREGRLGPGTLRHLHRVLHSALAWAARKHLIRENPADRPDLPPADRFEPKVILDQAGGRRLLADLHAARPRLAEIVSAALLSGCRRGRSWPGSGPTPTSRRTSSASGEASPSRLPGR